MTSRERFDRKVVRTESCWLWQRYCDRNGYGQVGRDGRVVYAHRAAYEMFVGEIPPGLVIDHLCRNPSCVNPEHLEPVTNKENSRRGLKEALKTHCVNGHPYTSKNVGRGVTGRRYCRVCKRAYMRRRSMRSRVAVAAQERIG